MSLPYNFNILCWPNHIQSMRWQWKFFFWRNRKNKQLLIKNIFYIILSHSCINSSLLDAKGLTPLHVSARYWHIEVAKVLIQNGCHMTSISAFTFGNKSFNGTAFRLAVESGGLEMAVFLIDAGYDLHVESYLYDDIDVPDILRKHQEYFDYFKSVKTNHENRLPDHLSVLCVRMIRHLFGSKLKGNVDLLPLPRYLKNIICLQNLSTWVDPSFICQNNTKLYNTVLLYCSFPVLLPRLNALEACYIWTS